MVQCVVKLQSLIIAETELCTEIPDDFVTNDTCHQTRIRNETFTRLDLGQKSVEGVKKRERPNCR